MLAAEAMKFFFSYQVRILHLMLLANARLRNKNCLNEEGYTKKGREETFKEKPLRRLIYRT